MAYSSGIMSATCQGSSAGAVLTELIALGAADVYLTANPTITFFRFRYNKHTNFALEAIEQTFNSQTNFGSDVQVILNRTGDLAYFMYVVVDLPGIKAVQNTSGVCGLGSLSFPCNSACDPADDGTPPNGCATCCPSSSSSQVDDFNFDTFDPFDGFDTCVGVPTPWASWTNAIGQFIVKRACLVIGGQVVSVLYSDFLFMWEELAGKPGKRLTEMIGKRYTRAQLISDSSETRRLYIPLPFWFTKTSGNALPLISLQFHGVQVHVLFEDLINCIQVSSCDVMVLKCDNCQPITANDLSARLLTTYVYLDIHERDRFATGSFEQLIDQVQQCNTQANSSVVRMQLTFNHPIIELLWCVKRRKMVTSNNHFNYSGKWGKDPVQWVHLRLNGLPRFAAREGRYFRLVEPFQYHTLIPDSFTYCFSFALFPEEANPSGSMNSSRIDNIELILELQPDLFDGDDGPESVNVIVFARNWNVFRFREGLGGLAFAN